MKLDLKIKIMCSTDADTEVFECEDWQGDMAAWDIKPEQSGVNCYFEAEFAEFEKDLLRNDFILQWCLTGPDVTDDILKSVLKGATVVIDNFEYACNAEYHLMNDSLFKPKFALSVEQLLVDNREHDLSAFHEFNAKNLEFYKQF